MKSETKHIAVVGAGLVGSLLSIYLARRGYKVSVFERRSDMRKVNEDAGRSINLALSSRGIKALDQVGMASEIKKVAIPMHGRVMHNAEGKLTFQPYGKEGQFINSISRSELNIVLINKAAEMGVDFYFNHRCTHVNIADTSITFQIDKTERTHQYDLIAAADGAFSAVRAEMQLTDRFNYSQDYLEHGYKELNIPATPDGDFAFDKNALHIWPRESFMMIALPNPDKSFTCTLFFPFEGEVSFSSLRSDEQIIAFFQKTFPDALEHMPEVLKDFKTNPVGSLVTIKCFPWVRNNTFLIGDSAHAIVPFYGQGMNAGFEDCAILDGLLEKYPDDWKTVLEKFQTARKKNTDAITQLAFENFIEMRDLVADPEFLLRKKIEAKLHALYPDKWIPLYSMITFHDDIHYADAYQTGQKQKKIMDKVMAQKKVAEEWENLNFKKIVDQL